MQTLEAMMSLLVFLLIASLALTGHPGPRQIDDSLYRLQLADDAWRVLHLRGDLRDMGQESRSMIETDMAVMGEKTGFCFFMGGTQFTNCRGGEEPHERLVAIHRTVIYRALPLAKPEPLTVQFTIAR